MIDINREDDFLDYVQGHPECMVVVYGAGDEARKNRKFIGRIDYFCDRRAETIGGIDGISCLLPEELPDIRGKIIILICIRDRNAVRQICAALGALRPDAVVFDFFDNPSFAMFDFSPYKYRWERKDRLRIHIVCEDESWILEKFARKLEEGLRRLGQDVDVSGEEDPLADVNHYAFYGSLEKICRNPGTVRTSMVTHIDTEAKRDLVRFQAMNRVICICMSRETMDKLSSWGIPGDRLCYVNPAQDGEIRPRKTILGITNRCYQYFDFRKRDDMILEICKELDPGFFKLKIMGDGWEEIVGELGRMGFEVDYYAGFDRGIYNELMPSLDYWLYYGYDEGAMGYLDALAAGVKTICTPQGYHLDTRCGLTHPCSTAKDFIRVLKKIQREKEEIVDAVKDWTWENYAGKHLEIWRYLTGTAPLKDLFSHQGEYRDGIFSLLLSDIGVS